MQVKLISAAALLACLAWSPWYLNEDMLFEDMFDDGLSSKWQIVGLTKDDYRIRDGGLEVRVQPEKQKRDTPMLKVNLPFTTAETVMASVEVTVVGDPLQRGEFAGLFLTTADGASFGGRKTNIDGYFLFSPGEVDFIGKPGEEGDPGKYTVKYWPADKTAGALRIIIRQHYAYFQVGPAADGTYKTFFHSAILEAEKGLGFGLMAAGGSSDAVHWVRFDNFRVWRP